ncbi:TetR/AcrR family transcriptional regulator C-terminal domain-containing protein [Streptomyces tubbatahanensis]|uniref:TetR/AcrR family transcriptional regulator C-terminal domain-containing protein n=1 Tax=Streptomyces tubbatahanensis TaxID=2923272 RepID=A0ABY3XT81_9ACTN|nr:TetR/AcrR family transcriptional regulator C-terminal domain-containing protein [Streptomyces tubbatahanensis]UNS97639.1 TetR/AcrR family transcriptional regulator C-terminal domain-containing protein [Streptomyces tubbatahanensis]
MAHTTPPPYARIAAELRRRITDGELAPGERVPSTRRLAQEWNVALATATRALTVLRQEGLVQARPRIGTVVATQRRHPAPPPGDRTTGHPSRETEVTRERVVRAAVGIADAEGMSALSMRSVAARLGTATMTAYRYVGGKDDLVLLMADTVLADLPLPHRPPGAPADWRDRLEAGARALWQVHRAHPWLAQIGPLTRPLLLPNLMTYSEWMLSALDGHGLSPAAMLNVNVLLYSHVQGLAVQWERETAARSTTGLTDEEWLADQSATMNALTTSGAYPTFTRVVDALGRDGYDLRLDELFELGLTALLDGVAQLLGGQAADEA